MTEPTQPPLSDYDFLELVSFDAKVQWEGFEYASEEYPPRFEAPELHPVAEDYTRLKTLWESHEAAIAAFWDQPDADGRYDRHQTAAHFRNNRGSAAPK